MNETSPCGKGGHKKLLWNDVYVVTTKSYFGVYNWLLLDLGVLFVLLEAALFSL